MATRNPAPCGDSFLQRSEYDPHGFLANRPMQDGPGYTGHITDAATGLVYMQQRYYDPMIPRFLSVDPVTAYDDPVRQFHRYRYAANNPHRYIDVDGRVDDDPRHRPGPTMPSPGPSKPPEPEEDEIVDVEPVIVEAEKDPLPLSFTSDAKAFLLFYGRGSEQSIRPRRRYRSCIVTAECHYLGAGAYMGANVAGVSLDGGNISDEDTYVGLTADLGAVGGPGGDINFNGSGVGVGVGGGTSLGGVLAAKVCFVRERSSGCE